MIKTSENPIPQNKSLEIVNQSDPNWNLLPNSPELIRRNSIDLQTIKATDGDETFPLDTVLTELNL